MTTSSDPSEARPSVIRETDDKAIVTADRLIRGSRHAALGVVEPQGGFPAVSRALVATDAEGVPVILVSAQSSHTKALTADPRASLLFGEPGKGDPLAHPRITVRCRAEQLAGNAPERPAVRQRFLARHPKAELYIDFPDFRFFRLVPLGASLNAGFGKAYELDAADLAVTSPATEALSAMEEGALAHMNADHADAVDLYAAEFAGEKDTGWRMTGIDAAGFEIANGDRLRRIRFSEPLHSAGDLRTILAAMAKQARNQLI